jgi:YVTN family beta-propeller protein
LKPLPLLIFTLSLSLLAASAQTAGGYHVTKKIPIAGEGSWDYLTVDESARRLYVSHGTQVEVLDVDSGAIVGKIANTPGVHGIAIAPDLGRGFVSNGQSSTVTIFDLKTLKAIADVPTGKKPDATSTIPPRRELSHSTAAATARPQFRRRMEKSRERLIWAAVPSLLRPTAPAMSTIILRTKAWC